VTAKVKPPKRSKGTLLRTRLVEALQTNLERKLQLVVAPAGFGKTTLLVDFIQDVGAVSCWATLDEGDREVATFVATLIDAIRVRFPRFGKKTRAADRGICTLQPKERNSRLTCAGW
jgi:LuxR family transcriptional regulator, maltose regulon positive regulatory protein